MVDPMDPVTNPYAPGAGTPPPLLAGRDRVIEAWDVVIGRAAAGQLVPADRAVGAARRRQDRAAAGRSGPTPTRPAGRSSCSRPARAAICGRRSAEALPPMVRTVNRRWRNKERAERIGRIAASFARAVQARLVAGGFRFEVEPEPGVADSGDLETDLTELLVALGEGAQERGRRRGPAHRRAARGAAAAAQRARRRRPPGEPGVACRSCVGGAGLPPVGRVLSEARSYAERLFSIRPVGALSPEDTRAAFEEPAAELGVAFEPAALDQLVEVSGGYPFFIQSYGKHVWDVADDSPIAADDVDLSQPARLPRARRLVLPPSLRPGHAGRAALHARHGRPRRGRRCPRPTSPPGSATTSRAGCRRSATGSSRRD